MLEKFGRTVALVSALATGACATSATKQLSVQSPGTTESGDAIGCAPLGGDPYIARQRAILRARATLARNACGNKPSVNAELRGTIIMDETNDGEQVCVKVAKGEATCAE